MKVIRVNNVAKVHSYPIWVGVDILISSQWVPEGFNSIVIITDTGVKNIYGKKLLASLKKSHEKVYLFAIPAGEKSKCYEVKQQVENQMLRAKCDRNTLIIAFGGGVVGDLAGFIAATYLRGVSYIQVPTSLLAMIDSSIGGKTGINTGYGKNLIGAIYPPKAVITDLSLLKSLSKEHKINGLIEAIKIFLTHDPKSFAYVEMNRSQILTSKLCLTRVVAQAIKIKAGVVERDEKEKGERSLLNFGHTIGHAIEKNSHYRVLHGYAVAYGILVEAQISYHLGLLTIDGLTRIKKILQGFDIEGNDLKIYSVNRLIKATKVDKKNDAGKVRYVLLQGIGKPKVAANCYVHEVSDATVKLAFQQVIEDKTYGR